MRQQQNKSIRKIAGTLGGAGSTVWCIFFKENKEQGEHILHISDSLVFIDDVAEDRSSGMNSEVYRDIASATSNKGGFF